MYIYLDAYKKKTKYEKNSFSSFTFFRKVYDAIVRQE